MALIKPSIQKLFLNAGLGIIKKIDGCREAIPLLLYITHHAN